MIEGHALFGRDRPSADGACMATVAHQKTACLASIWASQPKNTDQIHEIVTRVRGGFPWRIRSEEAGSVTPGMHLTQHLLWHFSRFSGMHGTVISHASCIRSMRS